MSYNFQHNTPPKILEWILGMMYPDKDHYTSIGDFDELYNDYCRSKNKLYAIFWYISQLIIAIPYFLKNKIYWGITMFKNNLKIAFRNLLKYKTYSVINISGLAIGLTCALFIYIWVADELSYDTFHKDHEQIYIVEQDYFYDGKPYHINVTGFPLGAAFKEELPEVSEFARYFSFGTQLYTYENTSFYIEGLAAVDQSFLKTFNFPLVMGEIDEVLNTKDAIVITEQIAYKFFRNENPIGKTISLNKKNDFIVTGVLKNLPENTEFNFQVLFPIEFLRDGPIWNESWFNNCLFTYLKLEKGTNIELLKEKMDKKIAAMSDTPPKFILSNVSNQRLYTYFGYETSPMMIKYIYIFSSVGIFILFIACINFMNLSVAQSSTREKEIGLKKVIGESKSGLVKQFLGEALLTSFLALVLAFIIISLTIDSFNIIAEKNFSLNIWFKPEVIIGSFTITVLAGILSGIYPAFILSATKTISAVKGETTSRKNSMLFRRTLIIVQFSLSTFLIAGTIIVYNQLEFINKMDLGFNKESLLLIESQRNDDKKIQLYNKEIKAVPGIVNTTITSRKPIHTGSTSSGFSWKGKNPEQNFAANFNFVNFDYFKTLGIEIIKGRSFDEKFPGDIYSSRDDTVANFIINKTLADIIGVDNPIGLDFRLWDSRGVIVGVTDDFNFETLDKKIEPMIFIADPSPSGHIIVRFDPSNISNTLNQLEQKWNEINAGFPFTPVFFDHELNELYKDERRVGALSFVFSSVAIFIALLGLFALVASVANRRRKEFGIRKVLGATDQSIIRLVSKEFLILILLANIITIPIVYYGMNKWLHNFKYRIDIDVMIFIYSIVITSLLALFTIFIQAQKAARINPVENLRTE